MKHMIPYFAFALLLLAACAPQQQIACTMDAKICPDGSAVGRTGPNCEFAPCPEPAEEQAFREYKATDVDTCSVIRFTCESGEAFSDETGCGCIVAEEPRYMLCDKNEYGDSAFFAEQGWTCIDACPQGYDEYGAQVGFVCVQHYGEEEIAQWETCESNAACGELTCGKATTATNGTEVEDPEFRCLPQDYESFMVHRGLELADGGMVIA